MTRIIGGVARGRPIHVPRGDGTRPTADRVREALFSSLEASLGSLHGVRFLDLYAGSGAVGLEAASRGAALVTCVERYRAASAVVTANARALGLGQVEVRTVAAASLGSAAPDTSYDVAFLDPPYDLGDEAVARTLLALAGGSWLRSDAIVVVERSRRSGEWTWPDGFEPVRERRYGDTILWYGHWTAMADEET